MVKIVKFVFQENYPNYTKKTEEELQRSSIILRKQPLEKS
jgi:hypothetical protein